MQTLGGGRAQHALAHASGDRASKGLKAAQLAQALFEQEAANEAETVIGNSLIIAGDKRTILAGRNDDFSVFSASFC